MQSTPRRLRPLFLFLFLSFSYLASGQVVSFAKTLPVRAYSLGVTPSFHMGANSVGLRSVTGLGVENAYAVGLSGGYGIRYDLDVSVKYLHIHNGTDFFGVDLQYLLHETRSSYFSVIGGLHRWDGFGVDLTGLYTYSFRYHTNLSVGLDLDVNYDPEMPNKVRSRVWLPVNVGFNVSETTFLFAEFDLQVSQLSWSILAVGANFIFR